MRSLEKTIDGYRVLYFFLVFFFLNAPYYFYKQEAFHFVIIISSVLILVWYLFLWGIGRIKLGKISYLSILYIVLIYLGSFFYFHNEVNFSELVSIIALILFLPYEFTRHNKELLFTAMLFFAFFSFWELILQIEHPYTNSEDTELWLFRTKNVVVRFVLPGAAFAIMYSYIYQRKFFSVLSLSCTTLSFITILTSLSSTGIIGGFVFLAFAFYVKRKKKFSVYYSIMPILIATILFFLLIYYFNILDHFAFLIEDVLHKRTDLTDRTFVWETVLLLIMQNPILGIGLQNMGDVFGYSHAHQYWLQSMLTSGIVGTIFLLLIYFISDVNIRKYRTDKIAGLLIAVVASFLIMGIDESLTGTPMLIPLINLAGLYKGYEKRTIISK